MPEIDRLLEYRQWAALAWRRAADTQIPSLKRSYRQLAEGWTHLADQIEAQRQLAPVAHQTVRSRTARPSPTGES